MKIKILYENRDILAIDKPAGALVDLIAKMYPKFILVHRLDKETSGVLLLAKNKKAHQFLKEQFQARAIKKVYLAVVNGWVKNDRGIIDKPIGRSPKDFRRHSAGRGARGEMREAETFYKVLKRFTALASSKFFLLRPQAEPSEIKISKMLPQKFTLLEVRPKTGRTHQIRVHLKYLNHPIAGDKLYNPNGLPLPALPLHKGRRREGGRMMLHAKSIEFQNFKGENVKIESPLPKELKKLI